MMHQCGFVNEALYHYSTSLSVNGKYTDNRLRLVALESVELIIREKIKLEHKMMLKKGLSSKMTKILTRRGTSRLDRLNSSLNTSYEAVGWNKCRSVYKYLSHHYILKRSVVFIVDAQFDSVVYRDKAI